MVSSQGMVVDAVRELRCRGRLRGLRMEGDVDGVEFTPPRARNSNLGRKVAEGVLRTTDRQLHVANPVRQLNHKHPGASQH